MLLRRLAFSFGVGGLAIGGLAQGAFYSGNRLFELCESGKASDRAQCEGYVMAFADLSLAPNYQPRTCLPKTASARQLGDTVTKWLKDNPNQRQFNAASIVPKALAENYGCK